MTTESTFLEWAPESTFLEWADGELRRAGLFDGDSDYGGMLGDEVLKLCKTFSDGCHSGFSAYVTIEIFMRLASRKPLTPLTDDPSEWMHIDESMAGDATTWQSRRQPACFSSNGGLTYYHLDEVMSTWRRAMARLTKKRWAKMHETVRS